MKVVFYITQPKSRWVLGDEDPDEIVIPTNFQKKTFVSIWVRKNGTFLLICYQVAKLLIPNISLAQLFYK